MIYEKLEKEYVEIYFRYRGDANALILAEEDLMNLVSKIDPDVDDKSGILHSIREDYHEMYLEYLKLEEEAKESENTYVPDDNEEANRIGQLEAIRYCKGNSSVEWLKKNGFYDAAGNLMSDEDIAEMINYGYIRPEQKDISFIELPDDDD